MASYLSATNFINFYSVDRVAEMLSLDTTGQQVTPSQVTSSPILANFLQSASGSVDSACRVASRYQVADLLALSLPNPTTGLMSNTGILLQRIVADLAFGELAAYKGFGEKEAAGMAPRYQWAQAQLEQLRLGERIFDTATPSDAADSGLPGTTMLGGNIGFTTCANNVLANKVGLFGSLANNGGGIGNPVWDNGYGGGCGCGGGDAY